MNQTELPLSFLQLSCIRRGGRVVNGRCVHQQPRSSIHRVSHPPVGGAFSIYDHKKRETRNGRCALCGAAQKWFIAALPVIMMRLIVAGSAAANMKQSACLRMERAYCGYAKDSTGVLPNSSPGCPAPERDAIPSGRRQSPTPEKQQIAAQALAAPRFPIAETRPRR